MKALVTGGAGFIGTNLILQLKKLNYTVVSLDNYSSGKKDNEIIGVKYIKSDIEDIDSIKTNFDICFHLAAQSRVTPSFQNPEESFRVNSSGTRKVMEWAMVNGIKVIYAGSASRHQDVLTSPYALSKFMGEEICMLYRRHFGVDVEITRFYNVYGPNEIINENYGNVIGIWLDRLSKGLPLCIIGDGEQKRDFIHVSDIVDALIKISKTDLKNDNGWELGLGKSISINQLFHIFKNKFNVNCNYLPDRPGNFKFAYRKKDKMLKKINWKPTDRIIDHINNIEI